MPRNHTHNLHCISATSSTDPNLRGRLWFCSVLGQHLEGPDPNADLKARQARMQTSRDERLQEIAAKHGLDLPTITTHVKNVERESGIGWNPLARADLAKKSPLESRHPAVLEAWDELPGSYHYLAAATAMRNALAKLDPSYCVGTNCPGKPKGPHHHAPNEPKYRGRP